jgi:hypothetical protein
MPKISDALISFGKLIGLMDGGGTFKWSWFGDPLKNSLTGMPANRAELGPLLQALIDETDTSEKSFNAAQQLLWERVTISSVGIGIVWNKVDSPTTKPLQIGLGANLSTTIASQPLSFGLLAHAIKIDNAGAVSSEFGQFGLTAGLPVPDFLKSASLTASYTDHFDLSLTGINKSDVTKTLHVPPTTNTAWDAARLAAFVVHAWVSAKSAATPADKGAFYRIDKHLFPMLGDGPSAGPIQPLPPLDAMGSAPNFDSWKNSVLSTSGGAAGALTFLWHLRALITGNESANILSGSYYFPLVQSGVAPPAFPPTSFPTPSGYPPSPDVSGAWLGFTYGNAPADPIELALVFRSVQAGQATKEARISIARVVGGALQRPSAPAGAAFTALNAVLTSVLPITLGTDKISTFSPAGGGLGIQVFSQTLTDAQAGPLSGVYSLGFVLKDGQPIHYSVQSPMLSLDFPLDNATTVAAQLVGSLLHFFFATVLNTPGNPAIGAVNALLPLLQNAITGTVPTPTSILDMVKGIAGGVGQIDFGDHFSLGLGSGGVTPQVSFGPFESGDLDDSAGISIGSLDVSATLDPMQSNPISAVSLGFTDVRLGQNGGAAAPGLVAKLFPDLRQVKGFNIAVSYTRGDSAPTVLGGGKIPIQRTLGPLEIVSLLVEFRKDSFTVGVDLFFQLGPISVAVYELGVTVSYTSGPSFNLSGLGLSFDGGGIKLSGMFLKSGQDYVGGAVVAIESLFQLSAIGGYSDTVDGASLFIFASLVAPLGGPPFFFITGIAGGFGFNRTLPPATLLSDHPFLKVMRGEISFDPNNASGSLVNLAAAFAPLKGQYWIAAGIQFTCFAVINGKVIVAVSFGKNFSFNLLGMLTYGIKPIVYFELDFMVTADEEHFLLIAGLGPNSYLIDPDIFSLQGQFGMGVWYATGDFVISIGGYHPYFAKPEKYPELARVGVKAVVYNFVHVDVQCFFACTPQALMAGASVSLYAEFAGISAGLDVYVDVLITWDPFYIHAWMGVTVWFHFMGRHEIGVDLEVYTPPFGGKAHIHIFVVSFTVSFGSGPKQPPPPPLPEFITGQLGVPATKSGAATTLAAFNTSSAAGLFRVDVTDGRATKVSGDSKLQEGIGSAIPVNSEFGFTVTTRLPISEPGVSASMSGAAKLQGQIDIPLCSIMDVNSTFTVTSPNITLAGLTRLIDWFPAATFGDKLQAAQSGSSARDMIGNMNTDGPSIPLSDGIEISYVAKMNGASGFLSGAQEEYSSAKEDMPLPLVWNRTIPQEFLVSKSLISFATLQPSTKIKPRVPIQSRRVLAAQANVFRAKQPWKVTVSAGDTLRNTVAVDPRTLTLKAIPQGVATVGVPTSPARRMELLPVSLRLSPAQSPLPVRRFRVPLVTKALNLTKIALATDVKAVVANPPTVFTAAPLRPVAAVPLSTTAASPLAKAGLKPITPIAANLSKTASANVLSGIGRAVVNVPPATVNVPPATTPPVVVVKKPDVSVSPTRAGHIDISGGSAGASHTLTTKGNATLRTIFLDRGGRVLADRYVTGPQTVSTPANTADVLLLHQGTLPPLTSLRDLQLLTQNIGIESDTAVIAMGARAFAAHGCVLRSHQPLPHTASLFDTFSGAELMQSLTNFTMTMPALARGATMVLIVQPNTANPGPALDGIRWGTDEATLSGLMTVVGAEQTAFVCTATSSVQWDLDIDLGSDWRVASVVLTSTTAADMMNRLKASADWDLIDDRVQTGAAADSIDINFEVAR